MSVRKKDNIQWHLIAKTFKVKHKKAHLEDTTLGFPLLKDWSETTAQRDFEEMMLNSSLRGTVALSFFLDLVARSAALKGKTPNSLLRKFLIEKNLKEAGFAVKGRSSLVSLEEREVIAFLENLSETLEQFEFNISSDRRAQRLLRGALLVDTFNLEGPIKSPRALLKALVDSFETLENFQKNPWSLVLLLAGLETGVSINWRKKKIASSISRDKLIIFIISATLGIKERKRILLLRSLKLL